MNGVDVANLHRAHLSTQRGRCLRNWRPHFSFLLNVSLVNCYILRRFQALQKDPKVRWTMRSFAKHLAATLVVYQYSEEAPASVKIAATSLSTGGRPKDIPKRVIEVTDMKSIDESTRHDHVDLGRRNECAMCHILQVNNTGSSRQFGTDITNRGRFRCIKTNWGYLQCMQMRARACRRTEKERLLP